MHRPRDLAPQVLLCAEEQTRHGRRHDAASTPLALGGHAGAASAAHPPPRSCSGRPAAGVLASQDVEVRGDSSRRVTEALEDLQLALEHVRLRLHHHGSPRERDELLALVGDVGGGGPGAQCGEAVGRGRPLRLVARGLRPRLLHEELDLAKFCFQQVVFHADPARKICHRGRALPAAHRGHTAGTGRPPVCRCACRRLLSCAGGSPVAFGLVAQSSGILIQPWRIAYTTACVRSFTDSLRRIELMWFLTVCSLMDSA